MSCGEIGKSSVQVTIINFQMLLSIWVDCFINIIAYQRIITIINSLKIRNTCKIKVKMKKRLKQVPPEISSQMSSTMNERSSIAIAIVIGIPN